MNLIWVLGLALNFRKITLTTPRCVKSELNTQNNLSKSRFPKGTLYPLFSRCKSIYYLPVLPPVEPSGAVEVVHTFHTVSAT